MRTEERRYGQGARRYKLGISILFGLLGFLGTFFTTSIEFSGFSINFIWSIILPLVVSLAYGPWYGLFSILFGGTFLYPFFLGYNNGYASLIPSFSLFLFIGLHGYGAMKRARKKRLIYDPFVLQGLYAGVRFALYWYLFPRLIAGNPPFWHPEAITEISQDIVVLFALRGIILETILLALAEALLLLPWLRKILKLPVERFRRYNNKLMMASVAVGMIFAGIILVTQNYLIDQKSLSEWLWPMDPKTKVTLFLSGFFFIIMGGVTARYAEGFLAGQEALKKSEEKYYRIFEGIHDLYMETTLSGEILLVSPSSREMLGYKPEDLLGGSIATLYVDPKEREGLVKRLQEEAEVNNHEVVVMHQEGHKKYLWLHVKKVVEEEGTKIITVARDVTNYKEAMEEIHLLNQELQQRVEDRTKELKRAVVELEGFTYTIAHDLKSPLRAIEGYSYFIKEDHGFALPEEASKMVSDIEETCKEMTALIDKLLAYSLLAKVTLTREPVDLKNLLEDVFREVQVGHPKRKMVMTYGGVSPILYVDRLLFRQGLSNILSNAVKFSQHREETLIEVQCEDLGEGYRFTLSDNGVGFEEKYAGKLFGILQRLHHSKEFPGSGVGLATVRKIVEKHGGKVWITGVLHAGATVTIELPKSLREEVKE